MNTANTEPGLEPSSNNESGPQPLLASQAVVPNVGQIRMRLHKKTAPPSAPEDNGQLRKRCRHKQSESASLMDLPVTATPQTVLARLQSFATEEDVSRRGRGRPKGAKNKRSQPEDGFDESCDVVVKAARPGKRSMVSIWTKVSLLKDSFTQTCFRKVGSLSPNGRVCLYSR